MEEEDALRKCCSTMIVRVRNKQLQTESSALNLKLQQGMSVEFKENPTSSYRSAQTSLSVTCQGPEVQPVPLQLISMLRFKTVREDIRRAAEVELHDPTACSMCEREQASLALKSFIRRKKTQLQFQALKGRLNTRLIYGVSDFKDRADVSNKYFCQHTDQTD